MEMKREIRAFIKRAKRAIKKEIYVEVRALKQLMEIEVEFLEAEFKLKELLLGLLSLPFALAGTWVIISGLIIMFP